MLRAVAVKLEEVTLDPEAGLGLQFLLKPLQLVSTGKLHHATAL